jgi:hypothetical protein
MKTACWNILVIMLVVLTAAFAINQPAWAEEKPPTHCHVHQEELLQDTVPVRYGYPVYPRGYWEARQKFFPFSNRYVHGEVLTENSPKTQKVDYCSLCRIAEEKWNNEQAQKRSKE